VLPPDNFSPALSFCENTNYASACATEDPNADGVSKDCWESLYRHFSGNPPDADVVEQECSCVDPEASNVHEKVCAPCKRAIGIPCGGGGLNGPGSGIAGSGISSGSVSGSGSGSGSFSGIDSGSGSGSEGMGSMSGSGLAGSGISSGSVSGSGSGSFSGIDSGSGSGSEGMGSMSGSGLAGSGISSGSVSGSGSGSIFGSGIDSGSGSGSETPLNRELFKGRRSLSR